MDSFYMTLPSNSSMDVHPDNSLTDYKVRLPQPLSLQGEWEVGLVEITYPHRWYNVPENTKFFYKLPEDVDWRRKDILPGYYEKPSDLLHAMKDDAFKDYIHFNYSKRSEKVKITLKEGSMLSIKDPICAMLGFAIPKKQKVTEQRQFESGEYPAEFVADVRPIQHLFVYTDIIEDHIVGDSKVPLIRTVKVSGEYGDAVMLNFENPHYIPLKQKFIDTIQTSIRDDTGKKIRFTRGRVILKLHFRQRRSAFFR